MVSGNGRFAVVASYGGGVASFPIVADGSLAKPVASVQDGVGPNSPHLENSHPHAVVLSPDNRFATVVDLGLDKLFVYRFDDRTGSLTANDPGFAQAMAGSGPRHLAFTPNARFAYGINEFQSTLSAYAYDTRTGVFRLLETISSLPDDFFGANTGAEVQLGASGKFLYVSNRGRDSIAVFAVDAEKGTLTPVEDILTQGKTPRSFVLDPSGAFLLVGNQDSAEIVVFRVDEQTGRLASTGAKVTVPSPVCLSFAPVE
jgi:6-phosphogluconolactonase